MIKTREDVSKNTIARMVIYYNTLKKMKEEGERICASTRLGQRTGIASPLIRRDLACFGGFGRKGVGYEVDFLLSWIKEILGYNTEWKVVFVGTGIPLKGIVNAYGFLPPGFKIIAVADLDKNNHGYKIPELNVTIQPLETLANLIKQKDISIGLINVHPKQAQKVVNILVKAGIKGIANFSPIPVLVPKHISLSQLNVSSCLSQLSYNLSGGLSENILV
ncbi:Redox-sensing transcriptional repressor Rex [uncultured Sporomusa sp.]|uniref:Redox-sensing transcriptional repressor Rex n=1 Tax=uncultured Sporomusa sp. TaxID=307249 RepID=A0A212M0G4_9FIRM|nr:redox-sensing transcriptional repressor Rex [uncultured Sporomusa sp.]SCM83217.1 Redox-sensing transcriptional repressor Rex [uncultured Sporomusa sp.]